jgi:hypothetical protein
MTRRFLIAIVCLLVAFAPLAMTHAQAPSQQPFFMRDLGSGVWAAISNPDAKAGPLRTRGSSSGTMAWS